jgi:hypothetical protein
MRRYLLRELALVEQTRAFFGDSGQRVGEMWHDDRATGPMQLTVPGMQGMIAIFAAIEDIPSGVTEVVMAGRRQREPVTRCSNRRSEQVCPFRIAE